MSKAGTNPGGAQSIERQAVKFCLLKWPGFRLPKVCKRFYIFRLPDAGGVLFWAPAPESLFDIEN